MNKQTQYIADRVRWAWIMLAAGVLVAVLGIILERVYADSPYNLRIITGVGILLLGIGLGNLVLYRTALKDPASARRISIDERDERSQWIRARAGSRAYWVSAVMVYAGLMWASFASNGGLPELTGDVLWFFLAAAAVLPFGVYILSIVIDQQNL